MRLSENGHYLPWSSDGTFVWLTDDRNIIHQIGEYISMDLPQGDDLFPISFQDRKRVGQLVGEAPAMLNFILDLAKKGNPDAEQFLNQHLREVIEGTEADTAEVVGEGGS